MCDDVLYHTNLPGLNMWPRGKARDIYDIDVSRMLLIVTDRISAFDRVMPNGIPDKGRVLNLLTKFWFNYLGDICPNHMLPGLGDFLSLLKPQYADQLRGRSMIVRRVKILPIECIVRGYLAGSGWESYQADGTVCGIKLPAGLRESDQLPEPIFTPSTKAEEGQHDANISFAQMVETVGEDLDLAARMRDYSLQLYMKAAKYALPRGIIIADTKFEFGLDEKGVLTLADEALTPDSSRFWDEEMYEPGRGQASFDKQFLRDYLKSIDWNKEPPAPELPDEVIEGTRTRYLEAYERLIGRPLAA